MPVQPGNLHRLVVARDVVVPALHLVGDDEQVDHTTRHVEAVEAGNHEERGAELRRAHRVAPGPHALVDQLRPF
ncbi:hypothetical protein D3C85_1765380 [compost metagenome]